MIKACGGRINAGKAALLTVDVALPFVLAVNVAVGL